MADLDNLEEDKKKDSDKGLSTLANLITKDMLKDRQKNGDDRQYKQLGNTQLYMSPKEDDTEERRQPEEKTITPMVVTGRNPDTLLSTARSQAQPVLKQVPPIGPEFADQARDTMAEINANPRTSQPSLLGRLMAQKSGSPPIQEEATPDTQFAPTDEEVPQLEEDTTAPTKAPVRTPASKEEVSEAPIAPEAPAPVILPPPAPTMATQANLAEAQRQKNREEAMVDIARASAVLGAGIAKAKPTDLEGFDILRKNAGQQVKELEEKIALEKQDPSSAYSSGLRQYLRQFIPNVPDTYSADMVEKVAPWALKQYDNELQRKTQAEIAKGNQQTRQLVAQQNSEARADRQVQMAEAAEARRKALEDSKLDKRFSDANKTISSEVASSRSAFGKGANIYRSAEAIEQLAKNIDPNQLDSRQITEIARNLDSMLSNGASTVSGTKKLIPSSGTGDIMHLVEYIRNIPQGAQQGAFVQRMLDTVAREKDLAKRQMARTQQELLGGYTDLQKKDPERWGTMMQVHGLPEDIITQKDMSGSAVQDRAPAGSAPKTKEGKVLVMSPQGQLGYIPEARLQEYLNNHYTKAQP
jgi:hypothetical protein